MRMEKIWGNTFIETKRLSSDREEVAEDFILQAKNLCMHHKIQIKASTIIKHFETF